MEIDKMAKDDSSSSDWTFNMLQGGDQCREGEKTEYPP